jgi:hypothetical protein
MERVYTPAEIATALATFERITRMQREAQHRYYERNADAKKTYAKEYYQRKKAERRVQQQEAPADPVAVPRDPGIKSSQ